MDLASPPGDTAGHLDSTYRWIPILGGFVAFAWAISVGAVDIPISFGPAIGSGALTLPQAVVIAAVLEITGAFVFGNRDLDTLVAHIMRRGPPGSDDALLMWGLFIALIVATVWLAVAVYWEFPASSSLAIWGAVIGVLLSVQGVTSVYWIGSSKGDDKSALRVGGVLAIVLAWVVAPSLAGAMSFALFGVTKVFLLRADQSVRRTLRAMPIYYGVTVMVLIYFVIYRAARLEKFNPRRATLIAGASGGLAAFLAFLIVVPLAQKRVNSARRDLAPADAHNHSSHPDAAPVEEGKVEAASPAQAEVTAEELIQQFNERRVLATVYEADEEEQSADVGLSKDHSLSKSRSSPANPSPPPQVRLSFGQLLAHTPNRLLSFQRLRTKPPATPRQRVERSVHMLKMATVNHRFVYSRETLVRHALAEKFDAKAEELFGFLQIMTACAAALAHGSNEVAWAMGPFSAILHIYDHSRADAGTGQQMKWVLVLGGVGASLGFALWGWKIVRSIGGRLMFFSPARGFSAQLSAVAAVLLAHRVNLPLSTTHILIGAALGVGLSDGVKHVNWTLLSSFVMAWAALLLLTCGTCAAFYSFTVYSPSYAT